MRELNVNNAVAITREIYWVGYDDKATAMHCNPYLLITNDETVFIDPGSIPHFPVVMRKVIDIVAPTDITLIIASHQDPDVCSALPVLEDIIDSDDLKIAAHTNSIRLIRHMGIRSDFLAVDENDYSITLKSGRRLEFIWTPFLHSPGAIMTYDPKAKALFSSDIFGAVGSEWSLFAKGDFTKSMGTFHQLYMPSNKALRVCMERIETLDIDFILPQHGSILEGDNVRTAIDFLKELPCGMDLMEENGRD